MILAQIVAVPGWVQIVVALIGIEVTVLIAMSASARIERHRLTDAITSLRDVVGRQNGRVGKLETKVERIEEDLREGSWPARGERRLKPRHGRNLTEE